jgi:hypothetical protein
MKRSKPFLFTVAGICACSQRAGAAARSSTVYRPPSGKTNLSGAGVVMIVLVVILLTWVGHELSKPKAKAPEIPAPDRDAAGRHSSSAEPDPILPVPADPPGA